MSNAIQNTTVRPTLSLGSTGEDVKDLQKVLNGTVADLAVDGVFGKKTQEGGKVAKLSPAAMQRLKPLSVLSFKKIF